MKDNKKKAKGSCKFILSYAYYFYIYISFDCIQIYVVEIPIYLNVVQSSILATVLNICSKNSITLKVFKAYV